MNRKRRASGQFVAVVVLCLLVLCVMALPDAPPMDAGFSPFVPSIGCVVGEWMASDPLTKSTKAVAENRFLRAFVAGEPPWDTVPQVEPHPRSLGPKDECVVVALGDSAEFARQVEGDTDCVVTGGVDDLLFAGVRPSFVFVQLAGGEWHELVRILRIAQSLHPEVDVYPLQMWVTFHANDLPWTYGTVSPREVHAFFVRMRSFGYVVSEKHERGMECDVLFVRAVC